MIITCFEKKISITSQLRDNYPDFSILTLNQCDSNNIPISDLYFIDASLDASSICHFYKKKQHSFPLKMAVVVYDHPDQIQTLIQSGLTDAITMIHFNSLSDNQELSRMIRFLSPLKKDLTLYEKKFEQNQKESDLHWDLLGEVFQEWTRKQWNIKRFLKWIGAYLNVNKVALFKEDEQRFLLHDSIGDGNDLFNRFFLSSNSDFSKYLTEIKPFFVLSDSLNQHIKIPEEHEKILKFLKMNGVLLFNEHSGTRYILFFSASYTCDISSWSLISNVKMLSELFLNESLKVATDIKKSEIEKDSAFSVSKEDYLRNFAFRTSNEFKNMLVSIKTFTQLLPSKYKDAHFRKDFFNVISGEVNRIEKMADLISFFASDCVLDMKPVNICEMMKRILKNIQNLYPKIHYHQDLDLSLQNISCDLKLMENVFYSLLLNASQAMDNQGDVFIKIVSVIEGRMNDRIHIQIKDTGSGLNSLDLKKYFEPFYSTRSSGLGLGLTFVKAVILAHKGEIQLKAGQDNNGAQVDIMLTNNSKQPNIYPMSELFQSKN